MLHSNCGWQKRMSWDVAMPSSEEIKPIALSIVDLCLAGEKLVVIIHYYYYYSALQ